MAEDNGEILKANLDIDADQIKAGMSVIGSDGGNIGTVKAVREHDFLLDRKFARDIYVPFENIVQVGLNSYALVFENRVQIDVTAAEVNDQSWQRA